MGFRIREINFVEPREIRQEVEKISHRVDSYYNSSANGLDVQEIIRKLEGGSHLRNAEIRCLLYNKDLIQNTSLDQRFNSLLKDVTNETNFLYFFGTALSLLNPWPVIQSLLYLHEKILGSSEIPRIIFENMSILDKFEKRDEFIVHVAERFSKISDFLSVIDFLNVDSLLFGLVLISNGAYGFFQNDLENYHSLLFKVHGNAAFNSIEMHLERYMKEVPTWTNSLGLKDSFLSRLLQFIASLGKDSQSFGPRLREVLNFSKLIQEAFALLRGGSYERANFWENISSRFSQILPRKFGKDLIGLALYLPKHVIVEFAPTGNAAYIYKREVFEQKVKFSSEWKNRDLAGDESFIMPSFSGSLGAIREGRFSHMRYWQDDMMKIVKRLENA